MSIKANLASLIQQIIAAEQRFARKPGQVRLMVVSKNQPISKLQEAIAAGQAVFGENYVQEALPKMAALAGQPLEWHFIGAIQSNKTRQIAENFQWVHSVENLRIAERLSAQRPANLADLNICIQVNIDEEDTKAGVALPQLFELAQAIVKLPRLKLRGLMAIPIAKIDFNAQRETFRKLRFALENLQQQGLAVDALSMGMSDDFPAAIAEGATIIRVGTAIFGKRG